MGRCGVNIGLGPSVSGLFAVSFSSIVKGVSVQLKVVLN